MLIETQALRGFEGLAQLEPMLALREAGRLMRQIMNQPTIRALMELHLSVNHGAGTSEPLWTTLAELDGCVLQAFVWPVGARTPIHDHTSWGVYACAMGQLAEQRYVRLDDGTQDGVAHVRVDWRRVWRADEQSSLLPYAGGIHRVQNAGRTPAVSLHLYGPRMGALDGRDYDPTRDWVCDRPPELEPAAAWLEPAA